MKIEKDSVVQFHYSVSEVGQAELESSKDREPMTVLVGRGNVIAGVDAALMGHEAGEHLDITVAPEDGYGERRDGLTQRVPKKHFRESRLMPGMQVVLGTQMGPRAVTVQKVGMTVVDVDLNHPMAGKTLQFSLDIVDVRAATTEELEHGHAHGAGGVQH